MSKIISYLQSQIDGKKFPGCAFAYGDETQISTGTLGTFTYSEGSPPVTTSTRFDLASLTKIVSTTSILKELSDSGKINLEDSVQKFLPNFCSQNVTLSSLLRHESGLPPYLYATSREDLHQKLRDVQLENAPGSTMVYSCTGFFLLQQIIELVTGSTIDEVFDKTIKKKYGLDQTSYCPPEREWQAIPPTSTIEDWRKNSVPDGAEFVQGFVHDPKAFWLGGVSGNAGLFGNVSDIAGFCQKVLSDDSWQRWIEPTRFGRGLGWAVKADTVCSAGSKMTPRAFGHTGFTGTSFWIDPSKRAFAVLLSNAIFPTGQAADMLEVRSKFADSCLEEMGID